MSRRNDRGEKPSASDLGALADALGSSYVRGCAEHLAREEEGDTVFKEGPRDSRNYGWAGPGTSGTTSRRAAKDDTLLDKAINRLTSKAKIPGMEQAGRVSHVEAVLRITPFDDSFAHRAGEVSDFYHEGVLMIQAGDQNRENAYRHFRRAVETAYALEKDSLDKLVELGIHNTGFIPGYLPSVYTFRSMSQGNLGNLSQEAIDSATEGIRLWNCLGGMNGEAGITMLLMIRGNHTRKLGSLEESLIDFRGACAYIRGNPDWDRQPSIGEVTHEILLTMAMIKHRDNAPRPHYTEQEQKKWMKELGIHDYSQEIYVCGNCGVKRSDTVKLFRCSACQTKWYCSKNCLVNAWKNKDHKNECKMLRMGVVRKLENGFVEKVIMDLEKHGFFTMSGNLWLFRDPEDGQYFDSLTDRDFRFEQLCAE